jgi:hypothetical protein
MAEESGFVFKTHKAARGGGSFYYAGVVHNSRS